MSYSFDGANDWLRGTFNSTYGYPITLAAWVKITDHPVATDLAVQLGNISNSDNDSLQIRTSSTDNRWSATSVSSGGGTATTNITQNIDNTWTPMVATFTSDSLRNFYFPGDNAQSTATIVVGQAMQYVGIGANLADGFDFTGLIAEVAIWDKILTTQEIDDYLGGDAASGIAASDLIGYWPLDTNGGLANEGVDTGGDLTASGNAAFNADHPTISGGSPAPTFDTAPAVQSNTSTAYTISYNADANATNIYLGAYAKDASTPSASQIKAGTNARGTATEATTGNADTIVLTPTDNPPFPLYDIYVVLEGPGGFSSVSSLLDEPLDPTTGFQFVTVSDITWDGDDESILEGASPAIAIGDIIRCSDVTDPGDYAVLMLGDGTFSFDPGIDTSRQSILAHVYDVSVANYSDALPVPFWVNNIPPQYGDPDAEFLFEKDVAITPVPLAPRWTDTEDDVLVITYQTSLPAGLSNTSSTLSGTPTVYGITSVTERATDVTGDFSEQEVIFNIGPRLPDVVGMDEATAIATIEAIASLTVDSTNRVHNNSIPAGEVISQDPLADELVPPDQVVDLEISLGPLGGGTGSYPLVS